MLYYTIENSHLHGAIDIPSSKSHTLRAILFGSLANGTSHISHYLPSNDTNAMIKACQQLGATITQTPECITIEGTGGKINSLQKNIYAGNSGIILRFLCAICALSPAEALITGDHSICSQRPILPLLDGLSQLGAKAVSVDGTGYAPIRISGPLHPGKACIDGVDSQYVSALLIASAFNSGPTEIEVRNPGEKPWVGLTLDWFDRLNIHYHNDNFTYFKIPEKATYNGFNYDVPGDFSSASFPIAAALITGSEITLNNLDINDVQGDKEILAIFREMGAQLTINQETKSLHIGKSPNLKGMTIDINPVIDAITILAVVACFAEGETHLVNGANARHKECDRIRCIASELKKMGAEVSETHDGLVIKKSTLKGAVVDSHKDHRMAMSLAVAGLAADGVTTILDVDCTSKTFPSFVEDFKKLNAKIEVSSASKLFICGLPFSGKTTFGRHLAKKFGKTFYDTDNLIEQAEANKTGVMKSCREIFISYGESYFRSLEKEQIRTLKDKENCIIALGGGALSDDEAVSLVNSMGPTIYLNTPLETIWNRMQSSETPAYLTGIDPKANLQYIAMKRIPIYEKVATLTINQENEIWQATP